MVNHPQFECAGQVAGLQEWRIENMELVPVPKEQYGNFFTGDSYLVLNTVENGCGGKQFSLHFWLGLKSSQDERGAAAILAMQMDDHLGGTPVEFREIQGCESSTFTGYFKSGLEYMEGGVASGFNHHKKEAVRRLFKVKGRRVVRATEVPVSWDSFNQGDCFILDLGEEIFVWFGAHCNCKEKINAGKFARRIRDNERCGRGEVIYCGQDDESARMLEVLGEKPELPEAQGEDTKVDISNRKLVKLVKVSSVNGQLDIKTISEENPLPQAALNSSDCFILDSGSNGIIFIWKGKDASREERRAAMDTAIIFLETMGYPQKTQIQSFPQGGETPLFKQFFKDWRDPEDAVGMGKVYISNQIAKIKMVPFDASKLYESDAMAAQHAMVDQGDGEKKIFRIEGSDKVPVDPSTYGQFYGGDSYIILYEYCHNHKKGQIIYTWQGAKSSQFEVGASAILSVRLDDELGGSPVQVHVTQGKEPAHLVSLFGDKPLVVYKGGTSREGGQSAPGDTRLFQVRSYVAGHSRAVELDPAASFLNSNDVFVVVSSNGSWVWKGKGSSCVELEGAKHLAELLKVTPTQLEEGKEEDAFWDVLGGKAEYYHSTRQSNNMENHPPRLFACSNKTGNFNVEEVTGELMRDDLATDDVMILDTPGQVFVWIGKEAAEEEKKEAEALAAKYIECDPAVRDPQTPITVVKQGFEPPTFTGWFLDWNDDH